MIIAAKTIKPKQQIKNDPQEPTINEESSSIPIPATPKKVTKKQQTQKIDLPTKEEIEQLKEIVRLYELNEENDNIVGDEIVYMENPNVDEEEEETESVDDDYDHFELKTGGIFTKEEVLKIELPKFMIKNDIRNMQVVEDKSTIMLTLMANESNQNIGKRIFGIIKNGFKEFKIEFLDLEDEVASVWEFKGAKIKTVDFGAVESHERVDPRTIMCEIEYDDLLIDKEGFV